MCFVFWHMFIRLHIYSNAKLRDNRMREFVQVDELDIEVEFDFSPEEKGDYYTPPVPALLEICEAHIVDESNNVNVLLELLMDHANDNYELCGVISYPQHTSEIMIVEYCGLWIEIIFVARPDVVNRLDDTRYIGDIQLISWDLVDIRQNWDMLKEKLEA